jgi:hypothetical protein
MKVLPALQDPLSAMDVYSTAGSAAIAPAFGVQADPISSHHGDPQGAVARELAPAGADSCSASVKEAMQAMEVYNNVRDNHLAN